MHPNTIDTKETQFSAKLTASGTKYTETGVTDLPGGFTIRSIRPPVETYYYQTETQKKAICLHFTVGYIMSDIAALSKPANHVSVSYVVDRQGNIYELFPDKYWSYHLGSGTVGGNATMSKQSIGIEISNYGPLELKKGKLVDAYGNTYCDESEIDLYESVEYRGKKHYATMSNNQVGAVAALLKHLCEKHGIPMSFTGTDSTFGSTQEAQGFTGIYMHTNVRADKFDWPICSSIKYVIDLCTAPEKTVDTPVESVDYTEEQETVIVESAPEQKPAVPATPVTKKETAGIVSGGNGLLDIFSRLLDSIMKLFGH